MIVIDLAMPRTDAIATIRQLKAHPASARIPVVALAGVSDEPTTALARAAGADVCLVKPCVPSQVASRYSDAAGLAALPPVGLTRLGFLNSHLQLPTLLNLNLTKSHQNSRPPIATSLSGVTSTTAPVSSGTPSVSTSDMNGPI